jgi:hypothetical protein
LRVARRLLWTLGVQPPAGGRNPRNDDHDPGDFTAVLATVILIASLLTLLGYSIW